MRYKSESSCWFVDSERFVVVLIPIVAAERACSLNLVIVRTALPYGPYVNYLGTIARLHTFADHLLTLVPFCLAMIPFIAVAACYGHLKQPMKAL